MKLLLSKGPSKIPDLCAGTGEMTTLLCRLAPKGQLIPIETDQPHSTLLRMANHACLRLVVGSLGGWISKNPLAYSYLARTTCGFNHIGIFSEELKKNGFTQIVHIPLFGGVAGITLATR